MFKFWRSPKHSPTERSPPARAPPPRPDPQPPASAPQLHGLGLGLPPDLQNDTRRVSAQSLAPQTHRDRPSSAQVASSELRPTQHREAGKALQANGHTGSVLQERNGNALRRVSNGAPSGTKAVQANRSLSPASFSPPLGHTVGSRHDHDGVASIDFGERDPTQIYAPTTWSEMAHHELVVNLSSRERTRQEILWEVVASEERYVAELRSLVDLYANPLLHPLAPTPSLTPSPRFGFSPDFGAQPTPSTSSASLPIASRFARTPEPEQEGDPSRNVRIADLPDMESSAGRATHRAVSGGAGGLGRASHPHLPTGARRHASASTLPGPSMSQSSSSSPNLSMRLASAFRSRHPPRASSSAAGTGGKLHRAPAAAPPEAPLPLELRDALEACVEMLRGHEELSARLKEQWARAFPLVRGLAGIWSDQPWFLRTYTAYVLSLEPALAALDTLLPSPHTPPTKLTPSEKGLARSLGKLEEHAADAGESGLGICLSKPLMRLGKLPLLMQALLYHTDPTTHEWEKTRAMALEVDALVRSIEDEKVEEEERERTRDALARIDGVKDKALMAPRAARILISEQPAPSPSASTAGGTTRGKFSRLGKKSGNGAEWLVSFTDVVVRTVKTGETSIPGSFSREQEKRGKQGAPRKAGKTRNTYRFLRVERWEPRDVALQKLEELNERRRTGAAPFSDAEEEEEDEFDAESRMSFRYDADSPQPLAPRTFLSPSKRAPTPAPSATTTTAKFGARLRGADPLRATTPLPAGRFDAPTVSSQAKALPSPPRPARESRGPTGLGLAHARDESSFGLYELWAGQQDA